MLVLNLMSNRHRRHKIMIKMTKTPTLLEKLEWRATLSPEATTTLGMTWSDASSGKRGTARVDPAQGGRQETRAGRVRN